MKKFVTGSLMAAGILAAVGVIFCLVSTIFGGRNLIYLIKDDDYLEEKLETAEDKIENLVDRVEDWHVVRRNGNPKELIVNDQVVEMEDAETGKEIQQPVEGIRKLELILGAGSFVIKEKSADDGMIDIYVQGKGGCDYRLKDGTFYVEGFKGIKTVGSDIFENVITLVIPESMQFEEIDMEVGAGVMEISGLHANEIDASVGAGELHMDQLDSRELSVEVGAGKIEAVNMVSRDVSISVSMGEGIYEGTASGSVDVECDMGNVELSLKEREEDFNYEVECGVGNIEIGGATFSGLARERKIDHGSHRECDVECSVGNVVIRFQE